MIKSVLYWWSAILSTMPHKDSKSTTMTIIIIYKYINNWTKNCMGIQWKGLYQKENKEAEHIFKCLACGYSRFDPWHCIGPQSTPRNDSWAQSQVVSPGHDQVWSNPHYHSPKMGRGILLTIFPFSGGMMYETKEFISCHSFRVQVIPNGFLFHINICSVQCSQNLERKRKRAKKMNTKVKQITEFPRDLSYSLHVYCYSVLGLWRGKLFTCVFFTNTLNNVALQSLTSSSPIYPLNTLNYFVK